MSHWEDGFWKAKFSTSHKDFSDLKQKVLKWWGRMKCMQKGMKEDIKFPPLLSTLSLCVCVLDKYIKM